MLNKSIRISHLHAKLPFKGCGIRFLLTAVYAPINPVKSEFVFLAQPTSQPIDQLMKIQPQKGMPTKLGLHVVAVSEDSRVVSIGSIVVDLKQVCSNKKVELKGVAEQQGYIVYSLQDNEGSKQSAENEALQEYFRNDSSNERQGSGEQSTGRDGNQLRIIVLQHKLKNAEYRQVLRKHEIFQLKHAELLRRLSAIKGN